MRAEVGGDLDGPDQQVDTAGPVVRVGVEQRGAVFAPWVEHIAGARLDGDRQSERVQAVREAAGTGGQVRREGVQMHVVESQTDTVVAEVGEQGEGIVETKVGETVGAVAESDRGGAGGWGGAGWSEGSVM